MKNLANKEWWVAALTRAIKTVAQTMIAVIGTDAIGVLNVNWIGVLSAAALAGLISILTSISGLPEVADAEYQNTEYRVGDEDDI